MKAILIVAAVVILGGIGTIVLASRTNKVPKTVKIETCVWPNTCNRIGYPERTLNITTPCPAGVICRNV